MRETENTHLESEREEGLSAPPFEHDYNNNHILRLRAAQQIASRCEFLRQAAGVRFEKRGGCSARVRVTVCGTRWTLDDWSATGRGENEGGWRKSGARWKEQKRDRTEKGDRRERGRVGSGTGQGSMERCSGTVVPCTQPNNRDQPSLMCA